MNPLKIVLAVKVVFTALFWTLPLLLFPHYAAQLMGMPVPQPLVIAHLLGAAFLGLFVGYLLGLIDLLHGRDVRNVVWVGIIGNAASFLILIAFAGQWSQWSRLAYLYMLVSTVMTLLITLGLLFFGIIRKGYRPS